MIGNATKERSGDSFEGTLREWVGSEGDREQEMDSRERSCTIRRE